MRSFNLIRYFTAASLGVILVMTVAIAWIFSNNLERSLTEEAGLYSADIGRALNEAIFSEFLLPRAERGEPINLDEPAQRAELDRLVRERTRALRILTVILFDPTGTIIYSTKPDYIGHRSLDNPGIERALRGETVSVLTRIELEQDPIRPGHDLLETYTPFYELEDAQADQGEIIGVLELYQDARPISSKITSGQRTIMLESFGLMTLLFVALFAIAWRGQQRIYTLTDALEESNRELEGRVRQRTREIERARERLQALFDGIAEGISVIGADYRVEAANSGIEALFGSDVGATPYCHARYAGRKTPCPSCPARQTLAAGTTATQRYQWPAGDGNLRDVEVTTFPFRTADDRQAVIEVVRDISDRSELERQIVQAESLAQLGEMAAGVAHEIRNPLGMIKSSAQLLGHAEGLAERDRELLGVIEAESARMGETISEFVNFASPPRPTRSHVAPSSLCARVGTMLRPEAERRKIALQLDAPEDLPEIDVDAELIYRALANLVLNALQVQSEGGAVRISATAADGGGVCIEVRDRGPGIADEDLERIFQPFFTRRKGGTGLGLSIVQRIVSANGGQIRVRSSSEGTAFQMQFPEARS